VAPRGCGSSEATDADLTGAEGLHEGAAEIAAEYFGLYDDDDFGIPDALHDLAVLTCERSVAVEGVGVTEGGR